MASSVSQQQSVVSPALFPSDIITPAELAARLKVKPGWVYEQMRPNRANPLPAMRAGRLLRFSWAAVCEWLQGSHIGKQQPKRRAGARG
jgi:predicted DNA-binding transcriptional regulator AlpA